LSGCKSTPVSEAKTVDAKAYALYGTFVAIEEQASVLVQSTATPIDVKIAIRKADSAVKPVADALLAASREYLRIKAEVAAGQTSADKLALATVNLERWVKEATPLINNLIAAVGGK
jgi:hypothetical protein